MRDVGLICLQLALAAQIAGLLFAAIGLFSPRVPWVEASRRCLHVVLLAVFGATAVLVLGFLAPNGAPMTLHYVWANSAREMPSFYKLTALWGGMSGSLLFWAFLLALFAALGTPRSLDDRPSFAAGTMLTLHGVSLFFLGMLTWVDGCQPFKPLPFWLEDGKGLNPLLQHWAMAIHPPMLYVGFVSMTVPYAYGVGALLSGELDGRWIERSRPWAIVGWSVLSVAIVLGGYWAYVELGWGGVWAWDPVENASFLPWLVMTALIHSVMVQEQRGMFRVWNLALVQLAFGMTIFGTFLTRSGILESVHSFAKNDDVGSVFVFFMGFMLLAGLAMLTYRWVRGELASARELESFFSREFAFLANNLLFLTLTATIAIGTMWPVICRGMGWPKQALGVEWYNMVTIPQFMGLMLLMGVGPLIAWRRASWASMSRHFLGPALVGAAVAVGCLASLPSQPYGLSRYVHAQACLVLGLVAFVLCTLASELLRGTRARMKKGEGPLLAFARLTLSNRRRYGGYLVHFGVLLIIVGFTQYGAFQVKQEKTLRLGDTVKIGGYELTYVSDLYAQRPDHDGLRSALDLTRGGVKLATLVTENRKYPPSRPKAQPIYTHEVALYKTLLHDVYVVPSQRFTDGRTTFLIFINPWIDLVFIGTFLLACGATFAVWPRRREPELELVVEA